MLELDVLRQCCDIKCKSPNNIIREYTFVNNVHFCKQQQILFPTILVKYKRFSDKIH